MSLKALLSPAAHWLAFQTGASRQRALGQQATRIIMFHGVGVPDCTAELFEAHLDYLARHFQIVPLARIVERLVRNEPPASHEVALTFDDGLRNNLTIAQPLLKKYRAPAVFFLCPGLVDQGLWLWVHEARERLRTLTPGAQRAVAAPFGLPAGATDVPGWMKKLPLRERYQVEQAIRAATTGFQPSVQQRLQFDLMTWDEIRQLDPDLITLGAHSVNHPILANATPEELAHEINGCRPLLEQRLGRPVNFFCYPNGDFNPDVLARTRETYQAAVTVQPGFVQPGHDLHQLPRIGQAHSLAHFAWRLHRPTA